jgi:aspartate aminotransferase-like enzyme
VCSAVIVAPPCGGAGSLLDLPLRARILLGPGPSNPYREATVALAQPLLGHLDPVFLGILDQTSDRLREVSERPTAAACP